jgi:hypothetical protein
MNNTVEYSKCNFRSVSGCSENPEIMKQILIKIIMGNKK